MLKKFIILLLLVVTNNCFAFAYEKYTPNAYEYFSTGQYFNKTKHKVNMYNDYQEHNKNSCKSYYCYIPDDSNTGYLLERSALGTVGYVWEHGYMHSERQRCHRTEDSYPVVKSFDEAKNYKD